MEATRDTTIWVGYPQDRDFWHSGACFTTEPLASCLGCQRQICVMQRGRLRPHTCRPTRRRAVRA